MQIGDRISAQLGIRKASAVEGQYGPQWELECDVQWSKYPERFWIPREANEPPPSGIKMVTLERTALKDGKDGSAQFHWRYRIVDGEPTVTDAPPASTQAHDVGGTQTQTPQANGWGADRQLLITWNSSVNNAQATLGPITEQWTREQYFALIDDYANEFYKVILKGPRPLQRDDAPEPQPQTQPAPTQSDTPEPKNLGELLTIAHQRWGLTKSQVADILKLDLATIVDFGQALAQLEFAQMESVKG